MNIYLDENLNPFFSRTLLEELAIRPLPKADGLKLADGLVIVPELNPYRTPSQREILTNLGLSVLFVSLPADGVWYLDPSEIRTKRWIEAIKRCHHHKKPFAFRCDLNATRLRSL
ncbi:MAG: hypothetical protein QM669_05535 [Siphonobacter sp.]